jgi:hypothetical protein
MSQSTVQEQVIARAMKDPAFRQALAGNPKDTLAREYDFHLSEHVTIRVLDEAPNTFTLVLPPVEHAVLELTDADLEAVSGGQSAGSSKPGPSH